MKTDLEKAVSALTSKQATLTRYFDYYRGNHPLVYTNDRLREIFRPLDARFTSNWCGVVVDAVADRINLQSLSVPDDEKAQKAMNDLWRALDLAIEADDVHEAALWGGEAYLIVWPDRETDEIQVCFNEPRLCHVEYDSENPKRKRWAAKWWEDEGEQKCYLTLYYPDRLEYYEASRKTGDQMIAPQDRPAYGAWNKAPIEANRFLATGTADNPYGAIPVFHFRNKGSQSDLVDAIPLQNGVNKLMVDLMVGAEFGAFSQKWVISQMELGSGVDANGAPTGNVLKVKNAPNEVWNLPAGDGEGQPTQVGQFSPTDLGNFLSAIQQIVAHIGAITRTPRHYFFQQGGDPSGESLIVMESPLNKKAQDRIDRFIPVWREAASFLLLLSGMTVERDAIEPIFAKPATVQPLTEAQIRQAAVASGIPLLVQLESEGWSEDELTQVREEKQRAQQEAMAIAAARSPAMIPAGKNNGKT